MFTCIYEYVCIHIQISIQYIYKLPILIHFNTNTYIMQMYNTIQCNTIVCTNENVKIVYPLTLSLSLSISVQFQWLAPPPIIYGNPFKNILSYFFSFQFIHSFVRTFVRYYVSSCIRSFIRYPLVTNVKSIVLFTAVKFISMNFNNNSISCKKKKKRKKGKKIANISLLNHCCCP